MRIRIWLLCAAVSLFGLLGWAVLVQGQRERPQPAVSAPQVAWEYKVIFVPGARNLSEEMLNKMGAQGWELITFQPINNEGGTIGAGNYFFKRAK